MGKGGGKADMAVAGGIAPAKLAAALAGVPAWVAAKFNLSLIELLVASIWQPDNDNH